MSQSRLSQKEANYYTEHGYLVFDRPVFSEENFGRLNEIFEELLAGRGDVRSDGLDVPHFKEPRLLEFLLSDDVLGIVEPLLGPDIALWSSHFISKEPQIGRATPWHEDSAYWKGQLDRMDQIVTLWLALDLVDDTNGCMRVIDGSHRGGGFSDYAPVDTETNTFGTEVVPEQVDESKSVAIHLKPNQASLHDARIIHGALPNTSGRRRCGYTMRYMSHQSKFIPENNGTHKIWHARGDNPLGNPVQSPPKV